MPNGTNFSNSIICKQLIDYVPDCLICTDRSGQVVLVNPAAEVMLGYTAAELHSLCLDDIFPGCENCTVLRHSCFFSPQYDGEGIERDSCEVSLRRKDGTLISALLSAKRITDPANPEAEFNLAILKDIRELKQTEARLTEEKQRYQTLFNSISDAVFLAPLSQEGVHGNFVEVNDVACKRLGYTRDELLSMNARILNPAANLTKVRSFGRDIRREGESIFESIHVAKDGTQIPVDVVARAVRIDGRDYVLSVVRDLRNHMRLKKEESRFGRLVDHSWDEIYVFEVDSLLLLQANQGARDNLGYTIKEIQELKITDIAPQTNEKAFHELTRPLFDGSKSRLIYETSHRRKNGSTYPVEVRLQLSHSEVPPVYLANVQDITQRKKTEQRLTFLASYDSLTGLPNRSLFIDRLDMALETSKRTDTLVAVIFLDLDGFKAINDTMGHDAGDKLIKQVGQRLKASVRKSDTVARLGGDEFTIIVTNVRHVAGVETVVRKIIKAFAKPFVINEHEVQTSTSMGITLFPFNDNDHAYSLIKQADTAMYQAKMQGKNNYQFYAASLAQSELRRHTLENELKFALNRKELELHYQPRVCLRSMKIIGVEALLRWNNPTLGAVSPVEFIPVMETTGCIREVGIWVLHQACQQLRSWLDEGLDLRLSVNVSGRQFAGGQFPSQVQEVLRQTGVPACNLEIEITEGVLISHSEEAASTLLALKDLGITISLDDFGSGYSSLNYLKQFPLDILKIDRSFIMDLAPDNDSSVIVEAIIRLAHCLRLTVTAEGIEDASKVNYLQDQGCDEGQGYYFGRPMAQQQFEELLRQKQCVPQATVQKVRTE